MTERERLINLISDMRLAAKGTLGGMNEPDAWYADYLLEHGVICPPCKVGDVVYQTDGERIYESTVRNIIYDTSGIAFNEDAVGTSIFLTREEAEAALAERRKA